MKEAFYDTLGKNYNSTRHADPFLAQRLFALLNPTGEGRYLDIGCGTGNYTIALSDKGMEFYGVDPSDYMLSQAKERSNKITWMKGTSDKIPFPDKYFSSAIATLTIHHWPSLEDSFAELSRVLIDQGRLVLFTSTSEQMNGYWLNHYFPVMMQKSTVAMPSLERIQDALSESGFKIVSTEKYFVKNDLEDLFLYSGKDKPEFYLYENLIQGISSFKMHSNDEENKTGFIQLKADIESGNFNVVKERFQNNEGDYLFVVAKKIH